MPDIECIGEDSPLLGAQQEPSDDFSKDPQPEVQNPILFEVLGFVSIKVRRLHSFHARYILR